MSKGQEVIDKSRVAQESKTAGLDKKLADALLLVPVMVCTVHTYLYIRALA